MVVDQKNRGTPQTRAGEGKVTSIDDSGVSTAVREALRTREPISNGLSGDATIEERRRRHSVQKGLDHQVVNQRAFFVSQGLFELVAKREPLQSIIQKLGLQKIVNADGKWLVDQSTLDEEKRRLVNAFRIVAFTRNNPGNTYNAISNSLGMSQGVVYRNMLALELVKKAEKKIGMRATRPTMSPVTRETHDMGPNSSETSVGEEPFVEPGRAKFGGTPKTVIDRIVTLINLGKDENTIMERIGVSKEILDEVRESIKEGK